MKIAHINNTAGVASALAREQRKMGHDVEVFACNPFELRHHGGTPVHIKPLMRAPKWKVKFDIRALLGGRAAFLKRLQGFDILHVHGPYPHVIKLLKNEKNIILHWHGEDLRMRGYYEGNCLLSTPDLERHAPNGIWVPNPVDLQVIGRERVDHVPPLVAHVPYYKKNHRITDYYSRPLRNLEKRGLCRVVEIFNMPHDRVLQVLAGCDVAVGKILPGIGWFGRLELEAMAAGVPVIAHVNDELMARHRPPVHPTSAETFEADLGSLLRSDKERRMLSSHGRKYVIEHHESGRVAELVTSQYQSLKIKSSIRRFCR